FVETHPDVAHRLTILLALVGEHVEDQQPASRLERPCCLGENTPRLRQVMQDQHEQRDIQFAGLNWKFFERSLSKFDVLSPSEIFPRRFEHLFGRINRNDALTELTEPLADSAGSASEIPNHEIRVQQPAQRFDVTRRAEELFTQPIPLTG